MDATKPQTDRELLLQLNGDIKGLTASVERLNDILVDMRETEIKDLNKKVYELEKWKSELSGGWKLAVVIWTILTGVIVFFVNKIT